MKRMFIGPGSAKSVGSFLNPESTEKQWLHGGKKTKQKAAQLFGSPKGSKKARTRKSTKNRGQIRR